MDKYTTIVEHKPNLLIEEGVMVVKDGQAWGVVYQDGHSTEHGWMNMVDAPIYGSLNKPTDVTWSGSSDRPNPSIKELEKGTLVKVKRVTTLMRI
jgi:hypothetical protein